MLLDHSSNGKDRLKPLLTSLNGDNSWLVSIPRPFDERATARKAYFHIVSDAWLVGPANSFHPWLISISLTETPAAKHGADIEAMAREIEHAAGPATSTTGANRDAPLIDLILINANAHDHLHEATLRTFDRNIPVMAVKDCVTELLSLQHFNSITVYPDLAIDQEEWQLLHPGSPLPSWLHVFRIGTHFLNFATAIAWAYESRPPKAILYSPHGLRLNDPLAQTFLRSRPSLSIVALLHALHDNFALGMRITSGVESGLALERAISPKYWVQTHDQTLQYNGIVMKLLRTVDVPNKLESALDAAASKSKDEAECRTTKPNFIEVANGSRFVLA